MLELASVKKILVYLKRWNWRSIVSLKSGWNMR
jgi:hypothetical protein